MSSGEALVHLVRSALETVGVFRDDPVVVAVSAGLDSAVLLDLVVNAGYRSVVAAHIDHGIRGYPEAAEDRRVLDALVGSLAVPLVERAIPQGTIEARARETGESVEAIARTERYRLLREIAGAGRGETATLLTAHHLDDHAETVLMRIVSGRSPFEPLGMQEVQQFPATEHVPHSDDPGEHDDPEDTAKREVRIVRPLLKVSRERLVRYATERELPWNADSTNTDERYLRNYLRETILPAIRARFPGETEILVRFADEVDRLQKALTERLSPDEWGATLPGGAVRWDREVFEALPPGAREAVLRRALQRVGRDTRIAVRPCRDALDEALTTRPQVSRHRRIVYQGNGIECFLDHGSIVVGPRIVRSLESGYLWEVPVGGVILKRSGDPPDLVPTAFPDRETRFLSPVTPPVVVRSLRPGDRVREQGRLRRSNDPREEVFVLEDTVGIVAIFGIRDVIVRDGITLSRERTHDTPTVGVQTND